MTPHISRRAFIDSCAVLAAGTSLTSGPLVQAATEDVVWHDVQEWGIEGRGFQDTDEYFDRLPGRARGVVRDAVWNLSRHSAGMMVRFQTDATEIHVDHAVTSSTLAMPHMPATGVSGLDLYAQDVDGQWRWVAVSRPTAQHSKVRLVDGLRPGKHSYAIYLPLYNGTKHLKVGVPQSGEFQATPPRTDKPIVFYGTSITHGACASRPGMPHPSILGRRLDRPVINLGFSGNGTLEKEVGMFLTELDPAVYVLDCLPNMNASQVAARTEPMVAQLRKAHPNVAIVLVEDRTYAYSWIRPASQKRNDTSRAEFRAAWNRMRKAGVKKLFYVDGESLLSKDRDDTTDGSHPSDLGFYNQANTIEPVLREALEA